ncbi:MAG: OB-fold-containig protein [Pseudomonadota bacterium]
MFDFLLTPAFAPFTLALALFFGLLALELLLALVGGSLLGGEELDLDADVDLDVADVADFDMDISDLDLDSLEAEPEVADVGEAVADSAGPLAWLGLGKMPFVLWLGAVLLGFGLTGIGIQSFAQETLGLGLPALIVSLPAGILGILFASKFGALFARLLPKTETQSLSNRRLGRRRGVITQGTASRGKPAEVRVVDHFGNAHHIRAEPYRGEDVLAQGTEVLVLRVSQDNRFYVVSLSQ